MATKHSVRRLFFTVMLLGLLLLLSCASQAPVAPGETTEPAKSPPAQPSAPAAVPATPSAPEKVSDTVPPKPTLGPSPSKVADPDQPALSPDAVKLLARADDKVKGYSFLYAPPPDNLARDTYYVKGDKVKVEPFDRGWFVAKEHITAVYLDGASKAAVAYCEDDRVTHCPDTKKRFPVTYSDYAIKMPYQWLKEIKYGKMTPGEKIFDRMTKIITYKEGSQTFEQWIDEYSGLPVRVRITDAQGPRTYEFRHLTVNDVPDSIFLHSP